LFQKAVGRSKPTAFLFYDSYPLMLERANRPFDDEMNIALIGYRCSGKTAVGKVLARQLGRDFLDTDSVIEGHEGCPIETIVSTRGWEHFRSIEKSVIERISRQENLVIATGGGAVIDKENVTNLKQNAWIIWLKGSPGVLKSRMEKEQKSGKIRPSLTGADPLVEISQVLDTRNRRYAQAATFVIDTSALTVEEVAAAIISKLPKTI